MAIGQYNTQAMRKYILQVAGDSPKFKSFLQAQNLDDLSSESKRKSLMEVLQKKHNNRLQAYELFWSMYYGSHWFQYNAELEKPTPKYVNYCAINVNKHMAFLMNKGFLVESPFPEIEDFLQDNWRLNFGGSKTENEIGRAHV